MNKFCIIIYDNIFKYLETIDSIKLSITTKSLCNECNYSKYFKLKLNYYSKLYFLNNINLIDSFYYYFNNFCYICKHSNKIDLFYSKKKYTYEYNICYKCKNKIIHKSEIKYDNTNISCINYPFYDLSEYIKWVQNKKLCFMISCINYRKNNLELYLNNKNMKIPMHSKLCREYILGRTKLPIQTIILILCKNKYLHEYTAYKSLRNYFYYSEYTTWNNASKKAKKLVLINNKYPIIFPWENNYISNHT